MPNKKEPLLPPFEYPVKYLKKREILEFVPNTLKQGEAIIVRTKKNLGLSEPCFVVFNNNGNIEIKQIKEEKIEQITEEKHAPNLNRESEVDKQIRLLTINEKLADPNTSLEERLRLEQMKKRYYS